MQKDSFDFDVDTATVELMSLWAPPPRCRLHWAKWLWSLIRRRPHPRVHYDDLLAVWRAGEDSPLVEGGGEVKITWDAKGTFKVD